MSSESHIQEDTASNAEEIQRVYANRDLTRGDRYAYYQPDLRLQMAQRDWALAAFFRKAYGSLQRRTLLDVGCGQGAFLRTFVAWGGLAEGSVGTELLPDRITRAQALSPQGIRWHLGNLESLDPTQFDVVSAFTVFSSIRDTQLRQRLAAQMWDRVKPGGWVLVFDFRWNNPSNPDVQKVTRSEMETWWGSDKTYFKPMWLPPPLTRRIAPISYVLAQCLELCFPFFRTHFLFAAQKEL